MYQKSSQGWLKHFDFMILDIVCLQISFWLAYAIRQGIHINIPYRDWMYLRMSIILVAIDLLVILFFGSMKNVLKRGYYQELAITVKHVCLVEMLSILYLFTSKASQDYSRIILYLTGGIYIALGYLGRLLWKQYLKKRRLDSDRRSLLIVTTDDRVKAISENIIENNYEAFRIAGIALVNKSMSGESIKDIPIVADRDTVVEYVCHEWVDEVFLDLPEDESYPQKLIEQFSEMGVTVHMRLLKTSSLEGKKQFVERMGNYTVLTTTINTVTTKQMFLKRLLDIAGGLAGCMITLILSIFLAPAIYIKSPGPIFFSQERVGKNGKRFKMYKFRSMYMDAEERKKELMKENRVKDGMMFKLEWDPRIIGCKKLPDGTMKKGIGNYIRDFSLDEFPQFFNVLKGDMSLVGTRPPTIDEWEKYDLHHRARLAIKPGVTGMWQVSGRSNITDFEEVVNLDREYINRWSLGMDMKILFKTVLVVFKKEGSM